MAREQEKMMEKMCAADGFIAALDQSGGSTPGALRLYGVKDDEYEVGGVSMLDKVHEMRTRIMTSPSFDGDRIIGAILFDDTMKRSIKGVPTADYLWREKGVVPFLKVDKGLEPEKDGVQLMKPIADLDDICESAIAHNVFGTKMRSVINRANLSGIKKIVAQQFDFGKRIMAKGLIPILEPEVNINSHDKGECEAMLLAEIIDNLATLRGDQKLMFKLTLPDVDNLYEGFTAHPNVARVVALSGGYSRAEAVAKLALQRGIIASFSRALTEGLTRNLSEAEFDKMLDASVGDIFGASKAGPYLVQSESMECHESSFHNKCPLLHA